MHRTKEKILNKSIRIAVICSLFVATFLIIQIINGKYHGHYWLVWAWFGTLTMPIVGIVSVFYIKFDSLIEFINEEKLRVLFNTIIALFLLCFSTLLFIIPFGWSIAGIGYKQIFFSTMVVFGITHFCLFFILRPNNYNSSVSKKSRKNINVQSSERFQENQEFQNILSKSKKLLSDGNTLEAIEVIEHFYDKEKAEQPNDLVLIKNNFKETKKELNLGLIEYKEAKIVFNNINNSVLNFISDSIKKN